MISYIEIDGSTPVSSRQFKYLAAIEQPKLTNQSRRRKPGWSLGILFQRTINVAPDDERSDCVSDGLADRRQRRVRDRKTMCRTPKHRENPRIRRRVA